MQHCHNHTDRERSIYTYIYTHLYRERWREREQPNGQSQRIEGMNEHTTSQPSHANVEDHRLNNIHRGQPVVMMIVIIIVVVVVIIIIIIFS